MISPRVRAVLAIAVLVVAADLAATQIAWDAPQGKVAARAPDPDPDDTLDGPAEEPLWAPPAAITTADWCNSVLATLHDDARCTDGHYAMRETRTRIVVGPVRTIDGTFHAPNARRALNRLAPQLAGCVTIDSRQHTRDGHGSVVIAIYLYRDGHVDATAGGFDDDVAGYAARVVEQLHFSPGAEISELTALVTFEIHG